MVWVVRTRNHWMFYLVDAYSLLLVTLTFVLTRIFFRANQADTLRYGVYPYTLFPFAVVINPVLSQVGLAFVYFNLLNFRPYAATTKNSRKRGATDFGKHSIKQLVGIMGKDEETGGVGDGWAGQSPLSGLKTPLFVSIA